MNLSSLHKKTKERQNKFQVLFFGSFIPLHGTESIVQAAVILQKHEDISFIICGDGQTKPQMENTIQENHLKNIKLLGLVSKEILLENLKNSDLCLGIFGDSIKASKVVTNKVFQILASKKPLITRDSPSAQEMYLKNKYNCILIPPANAEKLVEGILFLKNNPEKCQQMAEAGFHTYFEYLSMNEVGKKLVSTMKELLSKKNLNS